MVETKAGTAWNKIAIFDNFKEARDKKQTIISENEHLDVKIRLRSRGFTVISRIKEEFLKNDKKISNKNRKRK